MPVGGAVPWLPVAVPLLPVRGPVAALCCPTRPLLPLAALAHPSLPLLTPRSGMRCLYSTGWMHQSVRMVCASFLVEYLGISWAHGAKWFHDTLVDADLAINRCVETCAMATKNPRVLALFDLARTPPPTPPLPRLPALHRLP